MLAALPLLLALTPVLGGGDVLADVTALPELASAFRSICLERIADAPAQISVATAAPWNFKLDAAKTAYDSGPAWLNIDPKTQACAVTSPVPATETVASVQAVLAVIVPPENWQPLPSADSRYVLIALDDGTEFIIAFKISNTSGRNLTTFSVAKR